MLRIAIFICLVTLLNRNTAHAQIAYNSGFEYANLDSFPLVWQGGSSVRKMNYQVKVQSDIVFSGKKALRIQPVPGDVTYSNSCLLLQKVNLSSVKKGSRVRIELYYHLIAGFHAWIYPWMNRSCGGLKIPDGFKKTREVVERNNIKWQKLTYESPIDSMCNWINFGFVCKDSTDVVIDDYKIYLNDQEVQDIQLADYTYPSAAEESWMVKNTKRLGRDSVQFSDINLSFLKKELKDVRVVALGESTHGTKEFNVMRTKIAEYLIKEMDFDILVFENDFAGTLVAQSHFTKEPCNPKQGLDSFFTRIHQTKEVEDLIDAVHTINKRRKVPVQIWGCDIQNTLGCVLYLKRKLGDQIPGIQERLDSIGSKVVRNMNSDSTKKWQQLCHEAYQYYQVHRPASHNEEDTLTAQVFKSLTDVAFFKVNSFLQQNTNDALPSVIRDSLMALYIKWIAEYSTKKIIVWAHNSHIQKNDAPERELEFQEWQAMGAYLKKAFGDGYKAYAFMTAGGEATGYSSRGEPGIFELARPDSLCYEYFLNANNYALSFLKIDSKKCRTENYLAYRRWRNIGFGPANALQQFRINNLRDKFNGIFFIRTSTPAVSFHIKQNQ